LFAAAAALLLQAVDEYISHMRYVPTATANNIIKLFWRTIINYHLLSK
jgi:erythromycin esterase-like protein